MPSVAAFKSPPTLPVQVFVGITNGLFVLPLNFGANFPGANRWLQLEVRTNIGSFTTLTPRQQLTPAPYAITASNLSGTLPAAQLSGPIASANLAGTYSSALTLNNAANSFAGSGAGLTALNASELASGTVPDARLAGNVARTNQVWLLGGNAGTTPGTHFLGTTDNQAVELKANGMRALRLEPKTNGAPNIIGGSPVNFVGASVVGATIGGGGVVNYTNRVEANFATVSGGAGNLILANAAYAAIGGGYANSIGTNSDYSAIVGGYGNDIKSGYSIIGVGYYNYIATNSVGSAILSGTYNSIKSPLAAIVGGYFSEIGTNSDYSMIGCGYQNSIAENSFTATIGGGDGNKIQTDADYATIGGGRGNTIQPSADFATIPGGDDNTAANYAFAAGRRAKANHTGAFVWGDSQNADVSSTAANQFTIRAANGVRLTEAAGSTKSIAVGEHYRDNALVAWGRCTSTGTISDNSFGVASVTKNGTGRYDVVVTAVASASSANLIPMAIAEVETQPSSAATARIVSVNQTGTSTFSVFINSGTFAAVDNDFVFMVTAR
jgi:hypothetical protein